MQTLTLSSKFTSFFSLFVFQVLQACLLHIIHKGRYIVSNYYNAFFRAEHNASEMEAYCSALCQLRALLHLAQRLINDNEHGQLYSLQDRELSHKFVQEYSSMHKACFYGRCLGFQVSQQTDNRLISHKLLLFFDQISFYYYKG